MYYRHLLILIFLFVNVAYAHDSRPLLVEITELGGHKFSVGWKSPATVDVNATPFIDMPQACHAVETPTHSNRVKRQLFSCETDLSGADIKVNWPLYNPSISTMFKLKRLTGESHVQILTPDNLIWQIPDKENQISVSKEYLLLGIRHILFGFDHLLFVFCLIIIASGMRRILLAITGFTVAHSITLALATLKLVYLPVPMVESLIAFSIVLLATEIARNQRQTLTWQYPIVVASTFGLLHGFGFAAVLNEIGLTQTEIPLALLFFNLGVEIGQILFILSCITLFLLLRRTYFIKKPASPSSILMSPLPVPQKFVLFCTYCIGITASYLFINRLELIFV